MFFIFVTQLLGHYKAASQTTSTTLQAPRLALFNHCELSYVNIQWQLP